MNYNLDTDDSLLGDSIIAGFLRYTSTSGISSLMKIQ